MCNPGQTETEGCGNCGSRSRTCGGTCQWGSWSGCGGQGECPAGATESKACGDCGQQTRSCDNSCTWSGYSECAGPDPNGGNEVCNTDLPGECAEGRMRCEAGNLLCRPIYEVTAELCDGVDNDCNGMVDDASPAVMGTPPPDYAAELVDLSYPLALAAGASSTAWADLRNVGALSWPSHNVWLGALGSADGGPSALYEPGLWPAYDVAAVLDEDVAPGAIGRFAFQIVTPSSPGLKVVESFRLGDADGNFMACPRTDFTLTIQTLVTDRTAPPPEPSAASPADPEASSGCVLRPSRGTGPGWLWLGPLVAVALAGRRCPMAAPAATASRDRGSIDDQPCRGQTTAGSSCRGESARS